MSYARLTSTAVIVLGTAGAALGLTGCDTVFNPFHAFAAKTASATPSSLPASRPPSLAPSIPAATTAPLPSVPPTAQSSPNSDDPWNVVREYYAAIAKGDFPAAWSLLSPSMQSSLGPYSKWSAGYQTTTQITVSKVKENGQTVTVTITAQQSDGSTNSYQGYYRANNGQITSAMITQS